MEGFLRRNPDVNAMRGKAITSERINGATTKNVKEFFARLTQEAIRDIPPYRRYNIDEVGIQEGLGFNGLILGASNKKIFIKKFPGSRC